jgi:DNA-binding HxlR family transcriptional regulator
MDHAPRSGRAINAAVEVRGDPWAILVLRDIMFGNRRHFRELVAGSEKGIARALPASNTFCRSKTQVKFSREAG